jgi:membrane protein
MNVHATRIGAIAAAELETTIGERFSGFLRDLVRALRQINLTGLAAQVAYSLIFSMPSILLIVALAAHDVDQRTGFALSDEVRVLIIGALPPGVQPVVATLIDDAMIRAREGPSTLSAVVAILVALVAAGSGLGELATAFDRAAAIDDRRSVWRKRFIFTAEAVLIATTLLLAFTLYVWGGDLVALISRRFRLGGDWQSGWLQLQGPVIVLLVFLGATLLYMTGSGHYSFRETAPGGAVATLLWLLIVQGFQFYLSVANPGTAYGAASSVLVFLVFLYLTSMGLILGAMVAAVIVRRCRERALMEVPTGVTTYAAPRMSAVPGGLEPGGSGHE